MDILEEMGTRVGEPVTKHLDGEIWELRPLKTDFFMHIIKIINLLYFTILLKNTEDAETKNRTGKAKSVRLFGKE